MLRDIRVRAGLTQPQLAELASVSIRTLREIEQGRVTRPHPGSLARIADALKLPDDVRAELLDRRRNRAERTPVAIGILGPLQLLVQGVPVDLGSTAQRRIISLLALESERIVSVDELADLVWSHQPPDGWRNRVHVHIGQLRQLLDPGRVKGKSDAVLRSEPGGYRLALPTSAIDVTRFTSLVSTAARAGSNAMRFYQEALGLWRGRVLSGEDGSVAARPIAQALHRERIAATCALADLALQSGEPQEAIMWLQVIADEEPLHEAVHTRLMTALARTGQQDRALRHYRELRTRLIDEVGVSPSAETQDTYRAILQMTTEGAGLERSSLPRPAQLPPTTPFFAGRSDVTNAVTGHFTGTARAGELPSARVLLLHGMPGVGKTAAAVHIAHQLKRWYPDGQLYVDLQGEREFSMPPDQVLAGFLRALGIAAARIPTTIPERTALLRSTLSGRRVLMVLDDAVNSDQVLPLLPSDAGNDVIITSRTSLVELPITRYRLHPLNLENSLELLQTLVAQGSAPIGHTQATMIADSCAGLPLALRIASARLESGEDPTELARTLNDPQHRLAELHSGQLTVRLRLDSGIHRLSPAAQVALRRIAALPTRSYPAWCVAALLDIPAHQAEQVLAELSKAHMSVPLGRGESGDPHQHQRVHDLVRLHARDGSGDGDQWIEAVLLQWIGLARVAQRKMKTTPLHVDQLGLPLREPIAAPPIDYRGWFDREHGPMIDALRYSAANGNSRLAAGLLSVLSPYLHVRYLIDEWRECSSLALDCARRNGDLLAEAYALDSEVHMLIRLTDLTTALTQAELALARFREAGSPHGEANMLWHLQFLRRRTGDVPGALADAQRAVQLYEELGDMPGLAAARHGLGTIHREYLKDLDQAQHHLERALDCVTDADTNRMVKISYSLAEVYLLREQFAQAETLLRRQLEVLRSHGDSVGVASVYTSLGTALIGQSKFDEADRYLEQAEVLATRSGQRDTLAWIHQAGASLAKGRGDVDECLRRLEQAADLYRAIAAPQALQEVVDEIAQLRTAKLRR